MGQVPDILKKTYGVVGRGRLARHLVHFFTQLDVGHVLQWDRAQPQRLETMAEQADAVLLCVTDGAIGPLALQLRGAALGGRKPAIVHFSGGLAEVPGTLGAHPLMTFGPELYSTGVYPRIPFCVEGGAMEVARFREIFPRLPNPVFSVPPGDRARYHALCVLAGNFTTLLWEKAFGEFGARWGIPATALIPYLERTCLNLSGSAANGGPDTTSALTGPLVRGDLDTIEKNLAALEGDAYQAVYRAFVRAHREDAKRAVPRTTEIFP